MAVPPGLADEDHLVDAGLLVLAYQRPDLVRCADRTAQRKDPLLAFELGPELDVLLRRGRTVESVGAAVLLELCPHVGGSRLVLSVDIEVAERIAEEVDAVDAPVDGGGLVLVTHQGQDAGHVGVDGETCRHALLGGDGRVVVVDPELRLVGFDEREREGPDALRGGEVDGLPLAAGHPERWMWLLERLGHHVADRHLEELAVPAGEGLLDHHPGGGLDVVEPLCPLGLALDAEALQFGPRR